MSGRRFNRGGDEGAWIRFAAAAIAGLCADPNCTVLEKMPEEAAKVADGMLRELKRRRGGDRRLEDLEKLETVRCECCRAVIPVSPEGRLPEGCATDTEDGCYFCPTCAREALAAGDASPAE